MNLRRRCRRDPYTNNENRSSTSCTCDEGGASNKAGGSQLFLHHLGTVVLGRIAHHLVLVDWGLTVSIRVRGAVCRALPTAFHKNMSLFIQSVVCFTQRVSNCWIGMGLRTNLQCIFPGEALLAVSAREWLHSQMDPLMSLQIVVTIEGLWTLVTFERSVILLLLLSRVVAVH